MRNGRRGADLLFYDVHISDFLDNGRKTLSEELERIDANRVLQTPLDDLIDFFVSKSQQRPIVLKKDEAEVAGPFEIEVAHEDYGRRFVQKGMHYELSIPFEGDPFLLKVRPSTFDAAPPRFRFTGNAIFIDVATFSETEDIQSKFDTQISTLDKYIGWQLPDIDIYNRELPNLVRSILTARKSRLEAAHDAAGKLKFKLRARPGAPATYKAPEVRKRVEPRLPPAVGGLYKPEPVLEEAEYKLILDTMALMTAVMERSPSDFATMEEETLRSHFLVQLNARFESATGETFNHHGKTDILIKSGARNVFIAECKFWAGEKGFLETVDQILGYLTWRDTKAAILVFNRNRGFSAVLSKIKDAMASHSNTKRGPKEKGEGRFRYVISSKEDPAREIILTIMAFDIPKPSGK